MGQFTRLLCIVLSVALLLTPYSTLHAHIEHDRHSTVTVHGGHHHSRGAALEISAFDHLVDIHFVAVEPVIAQAVLKSWPMPAVELSVPNSSLPYSTQLFRPPSKTPGVLRPDYWQPPPRGPPLNSISAR